MKPRLMQHKNDVVVLLRSTPEGAHIRNVYWDSAAQAWALSDKVYVVPHEEMVVIMPPEYDTARIAVLVARWHNKANAVNITTDNGTAVITVTVAKYDQLMELVRDAAAL